MFRTLFSKLVLVLLGFGALTVILSLTVIRHSHHLYHLEARQYANQSLARELVGDGVFGETNRINRDTLQRGLDRLTVINPDIDVYFLDAEGRVFASSAPSERVKQREVDMDVVRRFLSDSPALPILGDDPSQPSRQQIFSVAPVSVDGHPDAYAYVVLREPEHASDAQALKRSYALREAYWLMAGGVALALLAAAVIVSFFTRRLKRLTNAVEAFRQGGFAGAAAFQSGVPGKAGDEIDRLGRALDGMAEHIQRQMQELKMVDATRREMLTHISHDLRTPLTSLRGHLETLLAKGHTLSDEEQWSYLEIAARQTQWLGRLVDELFDLAKLDAGQVAPTMEPFMLHELVQDIAQKFELQASNQRVTLTVEFPDHMPLVLGDIALLERVFENLIDNALRYTGDGGSVQIGLTPFRDHVSVEVKDTGCGIDPDALPRIFDRFYRGEKSRPLAPAGAGLGLAIAKRILELHGSSITVESALGAGSTFAFELPTLEISPTGADERALTGDGRSLRRNVPGASHIQQRAAVPPPRAAP